MIPPELLFCRRASAPSLAKLANVPPPQDWPKQPKFARRHRRGAKGRSGSAVLPSVKRVCVALYVTNYVIVLLRHFFLKSLNAIEPQWILASCSIRAAERIMSSRFW